MISFSQRYLQWRFLRRSSLVLLMGLILYHSLGFTFLTEERQMRNASYPNTLELRADKIFNTHINQDTIDDMYKDIQNDTHEAVIQTKVIQWSQDSIDQWKKWSIPQDKLKTEGDLKYTRFTMKPFAWDNSSLVCLSTQTTVNRLLEVVEVANNWNGTMSVSVYVSGVEFTQAKIMLWLLHQCLEPPASQLAFYFAFSPKHLPVNDQKLWEDITVDTCNKISAIGDILSVTKEYNLYPQNSMRNIAREECKSEYVILSDNDMIPSPGLSIALEPFLIEQRSCTKCAFVIPAYEINEEITSLPENKDQLIRLVKDGKAQPFHWQKWQRNQLSHDPKRWETLTIGDKIGIAYPITTFQLTYEPLYVARNPLPLFDTRFIGYGFTRSSQVFEIVAAGYRLYLLDNAFLMHRGMKPSKYSLTFTKRENENTKNSQHFGEFAREVLARYGRQDLVDEMNTDKRGGLLYKYAQNIYDFYRNNNSL